MRSRADGSLKIFVCVGAFVFILVTHSLLNCSDLVLIVAVIELYCYYYYLLKQIHSRGTSGLFRHPGRIGVAFWRLRDDRTRYDHV